jgi:VanZ family protein
MIGGFLRSLERRPKHIWSLVLLYAAIIFYLSSISNPPQPLAPKDPLWELLTGLEHVAEYTILGGLLYVGFNSLGGKTKERSFTFAVLAASLYGATDEIHQFFVPNRYCDIKDFLADSAGGFIGSFAGKLIRK